MSVRDLYPSNSKYLKAEDLKGMAHKVQIESALVESAFNKQRLVLSFIGKEKKLSLNRTNAMILADGFGDQHQQWLGKEIEIFPTRVKGVDNNMVASIAVRIPVPVAPTAPGFDDGIPF